MSAWDDFFEKAEVMVREKPLHTRYTVKYKHKEGKMVMKVTDNTEVGPPALDQSTRATFDARPQNAFADPRPLVPSPSPVLDVQDEPGERPEEDGEAQPRDERSDDAGSRGRPRVPRAVGRPAHFAPEGKEVGSMPGGQREERGFVLRGTCQ